eukprot:6947284-Prymnesium_polylepis.1
MCIRDSCTGVCGAERSRAHAPVQLWSERREHGVGLTIGSKSIGGGTASRMRGGTPPSPSARTPSTNAAKSATHLQRLQSRSPAAATALRRSLAPWRGVGSSPGSGARRPQLPPTSDDRGSSSPLASLVLRHARAARGRREERVQQRVSHDCGRGRGVCASACARARAR